MLPGPSRMLYVSSQCTRNGPAMVFGQAVKGARRGSLAELPLPLLRHHLARQMTRNHFAHII
jgi:hypothetical protein